MLFFFEVEVLIHKRFDALTITRLDDSLYLLAIVLW